MMKEIELHLVDAAAPSGEIAIKDLAALATALQELTTRISRDPINTPGLVAQNSLWKSSRNWPAPPGQTSTAGST